MSATATATRSRAAFAGRAPATRRAPAPAPQPAPQPARRPHLRVVETPTRRERRARRRLLLVSGLTVLTLLTVVVFHALLAQNQLRLDRIERQITTAEQLYAQKRLEHAQLSAPPRIQAEALSQGLVSPAAPPTPITVDGSVPEPPNATATTMSGWKDLKATLSSTGP